MRVEGVTVEGVRAGGVSVNMESRSLCSDSLRRFGVFPERFLEALRIGRCATESSGQSSSNIGLRRLWSSA